MEIGATGGCTHLMHRQIPLGPMTPASLRCRDRTRGVFTDQSDIVSTGRERQARGAVSCLAILAEDEMHAIKNHL